MKNRKRWRGLVLARCLMILGTVSISAALLLGSRAALADDSNSVTERCVKEDLVRPVVSQAALFEPGQYSQEEVVTIDIAAAPEECHGVVSRLVQYEIIKNEVRRVHGKRRRKIYRLVRWNDSEYRSDQAGEISQNSAANPHNRSSYYRCSIGRAVTKVRVKMRVVVADAGGQQELRRGTFWGPPLEIHGIGHGKGC